MWSGAAPRRRRWSARWASCLCRTARSTSFPAAASSRSTSAPATTQTRDAAVSDVLAEIKRIAERRGVAIEVKEIARGHNVPCSPRIQRLLAEAITRAGIAVRSLPSGAGHDAMQFDGVTELGMLFVRCGNGGVSHSPLETITAADADLAARILLDAIMNFEQARMTIADQISAFVDRDFARETAFLAELVKVPSDNPPGDCAAHAARAKALLEGLGLSVEAHRGAAFDRRGGRHEERDQSHRAPPLRRRPDGRAQCPWRRRAARARVDASILTAPWSRTGRTARSCTGAASRCRSRISRPTPLRCLR